MLNYRGREIFLKDTMHNEADTCRTYVVPNLKTARWDDDYIVEQILLTPGRELRLRTLSPPGRYAVPYVPALSLPKGWIGRLRESFDCDGFNHRELYCPKAMEIGLWDK